MTNFKGSCLRCQKKCSIENIYCNTCVDWLVVNKNLVKCKKCLREGYWHNGYCPDHQPQKKDRP